MNLRTSFSVALLTLALFSGCDKPPASGSATMTTNGIKVTADGAGPSVSSDGKVITVSVDGRKVIIQDDDILVGGIKQAKIPPDAKAIRVFSRNNTLVIEIDGKEVALAAS